jgi:hypothetical protein
MGRGGQLMPHAMPYGPPYGPPGAGPRLHSWQLVEGGTAVEVALIVGGRMFRGRLGNTGGMLPPEEELLVRRPLLPTLPPACCRLLLWAGLAGAAAWAACWRWLPAGLPRQPLPLHRLAPPLHARPAPPQASRALPRYGPEAAPPPALLHFGPELEQGGMFPRCALCMRPESPAVTAADHSAGARPGPRWAGSAPRALCRLRAAALASAPALLARAASPLLAVRRRRCSRPDRPPPC